jgi:hypothetical protein
MHMHIRSTRAETGIMSPTRVFVKPWQAFPLVEAQTLEACHASAGLVVPPHPRRRRRPRTPSSPSSRSSTFADPRCTARGSRDPLRSSTCARCTFCAAARRSQGAASSRAIASARRAAGGRACCRRTLHPRAAALCTPCPSPGTSPAFADSCPGICTRASSSSSPSRTPRRAPAGSHAVSAARDRRQS